MKERSEESPKESTQPPPEEGVPEEPEIEDIIPQEVLEKLPPEDQKIVRRAISFGSMTLAGPMPNPVLSKVTPEHVNKMIEYTENDNIREHQAETSTRRYTFLYFIIAAVLLVGILVYLSLMGLTELFLQILLILGGIGAGFGLGRLRRSGE